MNGAPKQTFDQYRSAEGLNWSALKHIAHSAAKYRRMADNPDLDPDTASRGMLRAIHAAILEPAVFRKEYRPFQGRRAGQAWEAQLEANPGTTFLNEKESATVLGVARAVRSHPAALALLTGAAREQSIFWQEGGRKMKGRLDAVKFEGDRTLIIDLKCVPSTLPRPVAAQVARMLYHGQLAHYAAGVSAVWGLPVERIDGALIVYEDREPFDVAVYHVDANEGMYTGQKCREFLLNRLAMAEASGLWGPREGGTQELILPDWALGMDNNDEGEVDDGA